MKIIKVLFLIPKINLLIIFKISLRNKYLLASVVRDEEIIFKNVCTGFDVRVGSVLMRRSKSLKLSDHENKGIANEGIEYMKGYRYKLKYGYDQILPKWITINAEKG